MNINAQTKEQTIKRIEEVNSNYYKSVKASLVVADDILSGLTEEEIKLLASLPKSELTVKVGFTLWDVIKTAFGK